MSQSRSSRTAPGHPTKLLLLLALFQLPCILWSQEGCDECVYYEIKHFTRVQDHPTLGDWEQIRLRCLPSDEERYINVAAEGSVSTKVEIELVVTGGCIYENIDPLVEFVDEFNEPIDSPTPEEHGIIDAISMNASSIHFEYTHPTDPPQGNEHYREVRILLKDYSADADMYFAYGWIVIRVHRPPVLMVHGLWSDASPFQDMVNDFESNKYYPYMVARVDYNGTAGHDFATNSGFVPAGLDAVHQGCRESGLAAGKTNLVSHSMGGMLCRQYLQTNFRNDVYRLITLNTPHVGSQLSNLLLDTLWNPLNQIACAFLTVMGGSCYDGALHDLQVGSPATDSINAGVHPPEVGVHAIATVHDAPSISALKAGLVSRSVLVAFLVATANNCSEQVFDTLFNNDEHDLMVAKGSQYGGLSGTPTTYISDQIHLYSAKNTALINAVKSLLDKDYSSGAFVNSGYAPPPTISYNGNLGCDPWLDSSPKIELRSSDSLQFDAPAPNTLSVMAGDTIEVTVSGAGNDTIVIACEYGLYVYMDKAVGPSATFHVPIASSANGTIGIGAFCYTTTGALSGTITDSIQVDQPFELVGISSSATFLCAGVGDSVELTIIGHYDDGMDRSLNGDPDLQYHFQQGSATNIANGYIEILEPFDDTLIVMLDTFKTDTIFITGLVSSSGPVTWLGGTGVWTDHTKWSIGCPPGPSNPVYITSGTCTIPEGYEAEALTLSLTDANLTINGQLHIANSSSTALHVKTSTLQNDGTIQIQNINNTAIWVQGTASTDSAFFINSGTMLLDSCLSTYGIYLDVHSKFINDTPGSLTQCGCGQFDAIVASYSTEPKLINMGTLTVKNSGDLSGSGRLSEHGTTADPARLAGYLRRV